MSDGLDAHRLDLYLPKDRGTAPLVVFVHGGAFMYGDRRESKSVGEALAHEGIATAVVSYRLFPKTNALGSTADVAQAVAWLVKHGTEYGLTGSAIFLAGHSADKS
jgi:acetyl esterase/lipase